MLFKFATEKDTSRVLNGALWTFEKNLLALTAYNGDLRPVGYKFDRLSIWVRVYGLPLNFMSQELAERIGCKIRTLQTIDLHALQSSWGKNLRMRVEIDLNKPYRRFVSLINEGSPNNLWVRLNYECLPFFCYSCGIIDHGESDYDVVDVNNVENVKQYGDWLRASHSLRVRSCFQRIVGVSSTKRSAA
ncbi:hypothetical protein DITRI_Ditri17bG0021100 [Diplodiscus trichospermus]